MDQAILGGSDSPSDDVVSIEGDQDMVFLEESYVPGPGYEVILAATGGQVVDCPSGEPIVYECDYGVGV